MVIATKLRVHINTICNMCTPPTIPGRIVNVTSVHGQMAIPRKSNYEVTKHGLETVSDSLRLEMAKFGVRVSVVEPGDFAFATAIHTEAMVGCTQFLFCVLIVEEPVLIYNNTNTKDATETNP